MLFPVDHWSVEGLRSLWARYSYREPGLPPQTGVAALPPLVDTVDAHNIEPTETLIVRVTGMTWGRAPGRWVEPLPPEQRDDRGTGRCQCGDCVAAGVTREFRAAAFSGLVLPAPDLLPDVPRDDFR